MSEDPIEFDTVLGLCRDRHRRIVLALFAAQRRTLTVRDLTRAVVKHNHHAQLPAVSEETLRRIRYSLHHVHVPKLAASGVVEYDRDRQLVNPTDRFDQLQPALSAIVAADPDLEPPVEL